MRGFAVSLILLAGTIPSVFAGQIADRYGRLPVICLGACVFAVGTICEAAAAQLPVLLLGRVLGGLGEGIWLSNVTVYITEIAPKARRGVLVSMPQFGSTAGICLGFVVTCPMSRHISPKSNLCNSYFTCYGSARLDSNWSWRAPFLIQTILAVILAISCVTVLPPSPRWLVLNRRRPEALSAVEKLGIPQAEAEKDILQAPESQEGEAKSYLKGFTILFQRKHRSRTVLALFVLGMVQLSGIDGVLYVSLYSLSQLHPH